MLSTKLKPMVLKKMAFKLLPILLHFLIHIDYTESLYKCQTYLYIKTLIYS